jgi:cellulose synthase/poly-beta-1,6-N-acetylglucosamine synthase-like glycosyltransferase
MICFYLLWTMSYFVLLNWFAGKWPKQRREVDSEGYLPAITLLIPLRNELENLESLIPELGKIAYPKLEILLVDDQSEDGTFSSLQEMTKGDSRVRVLKSPGAGKKAAIQCGVEAARTELILCSDADCRFPKVWVERMAEAFLDSKVQLVAGPVITSGELGFFQRFQQIEWASILLVTKFFFSQKRPLLCSAANFAYRKSAFLEVGGYGGNLQFWSGDDEFLLKKILAKFGKESCVYLPCTENLIYTKAQPTFSDLISQRIRWASKWKYHGDWGHAFSAIGAFLVQAIWLASAGLFCLGIQGILAFFVVWAGKVVAEKLTLGRVLTTLHLRRSLVDFMKTSFFHPFYILTVTVGTVRGKFVWKGRAN